MNFNDLGLSKNTIEAITKLGFSEPTEVQIKTIPEIISGQNLLVRSQTGTGKTAAFGIGIVERLAAAKSRKALVLTPTRELALQVWKEIQNLAGFHSLHVQVVYGGHNIEREIHSLHQGVDILIATPGRLLDLTRRQAVRLGEFDMVVLDEADMMLDMGFIEDVGIILDQLPPQRLSMLVSATLEPGILSLASKYVTHAKTVEVGEKVVVSTIKEEFVETTALEKFPHLLNILRSHARMKTLIFTQTKRGADRLQEKLWDRGFKAGLLEGDMSQSKRTASLAAFQEGRTNILVATNVAARGLHIEDLGLIVNYDRAETDEVHLHRVGRTGRMGEEGKAITFIHRKESREERLRDDHPDFAWMRGGGSPSSQYGARERSGGHYQSREGGHHHGGDRSYGGRPHSGSYSHGGGHPQSRRHQRRR